MVICCGASKTLRRLKHYGKVSETPCLPGESSQKISTNSELLRDSKLVRRSFFSTAGSFGNKGTDSQIACDPFTNPAWAPDLLRIWPALLGKTDKSAMEGGGELKNRFVGDL